MSFFLRIFSVLLLTVLFSYAACADFADVWGGRVQTSQGISKKERAPKASKEAKPKSEKIVKNEKPAKKAPAKKEKTPKKIADKTPVASEAAKEKDPDDKDFIWPVDGRMTSGFGPRRQRDHDGIDIVAPKGTPVMASRDGTVLFTGNMSGYGSLIILKHRGNFFTAYAHLSQNNVKKEQKVKAGEVIGKVGRTGRASTTHLHFEIRHKTKPVDPMPYLPPFEASKKPIK